MCTSKGRKMVMGELAVQIFWEEYRDNLMQMREEEPERQIRYYRGL